MSLVFQRAVLVVGVALFGLCAAPANATKIDKTAIKETCSTAGGSYSEGSNYARCQYSNGDSYTCNTDVNQCESCTGGKCTVSIKRPGGVGAPPNPAVKAPPSPTAPKPLMPATKSAPMKKLQ